MKKILVAFTDEQAKVLAKQVNMSATVRSAVDIYIESISTDTLEGMRASYETIAKAIKQQGAKTDELYDAVERLTKVISEATSR